MQKIEIFPWTDKFATGLSLVDEQHQTIVTLINELAVHHTSNADIDTLKKAFVKLGEYAVYHFETEESVWHEFLPDEEEEIEHKKTHAKFLEAVGQIKLQQSEKPVGQVLDEVLRFLVRWLIHHILEDDMHLSKIVHGVNSGLSVDDAKVQAHQEMHYAMNVLTDSILNMYDGLASRTMELMREAHLRQSAEKQLQLASVMVENTLDAICVLDPQCNVVAVNPAFQTAMKCQEGDVLNRQISDVIAITIDGHNNESLEQNISSGKWSGVVSRSNGDGEKITEWCSTSASKDSEGNIEQIIVIFTNISGLINKHKEIEYLAHHDALTQLPNRLALLEHIDIARNNSLRNDTFVAVCFIDLDGFKFVNDNFGHDAGDQVLIKTTERLKELIRKEDTLARLGGDEFILLVSNLTQGDAIMVLLDKVVIKVKQSIKLLNSEQEVVVTASIGVTVFPNDRSDTDTLIAHADSAMYQAKKSGKSCYKFYQS